MLKSLIILPLVSALFLLSSAESCDVGPCSYDQRAEKNRLMNGGDEPDDVPQYAKFALNSQGTDDFAPYRHKFARKADEPMRFAHSDRRFAETDENARKFALSDQKEMKFAEKEVKAHFDVDHY